VAETLLLCDMRKRLAFWSIIFLSEWLDEI